MLYEVFVATIVLAWMGSTLALVSMGMYYSDGKEIPARIFIVLSCIWMVSVMVIVSWAS